MKKIFVLLLLSIISFGAYCQIKPVTHFLGIPVDGKKSAIFKELKKKGFKNAKYGDYKMLTGSFNGNDVYVDAVENSKKEVYRIVINDKIPTDANGIRVRFNMLCKQFENNPKYISATNNVHIPEDEDISYEFGHGKEYLAIFFQKPTEEEDSIIWNITQTKYLTDNLLKSNTEDLSEEEYIEKATKEIEKVYFETYTKFCKKKPVWFTIFERPITRHEFSKYRFEIVMYYDNEYNKANGEDI